MILSYLMSYLEHMAYYLCTGYESLNRSLLFSNNDNTHRKKPNYTIAIIFSPNTYNDRLIEVVLYS